MNDISLQGVPWAVGWSEQGASLTPFNVEFFWGQMTPKRKIFENLKIFEWA